MSKNWCGGMDLLGGIIFDSVAETLVASAGAGVRHLGERGTTRNRYRYVTRVTVSAFAGKVRGLLSGHQGVPATPLHEAQR